MRPTPYDILSGCPSIIEISDFVTSIETLLAHSIQAKHRLELESVRPLFERLSKKHPEGATLAEIGRRDFDRFVAGIGTVLGISSKYGAILYYTEPKEGSR